MSKKNDEPAVEPVELRLDLKSALEHYKKETGEELSVYKLAKKVSVPRQSLAKWENGESLKTLNGVFEIAKATGYPLMSLIVKK